MKTRVPDEVVEAIRERSDVVAIVGEVVELRKAGSNLKGLCPFHQEKTPSFNVNPNRGTYHCFGCGQGGDAIAFVRELHGLTFVDALRFLGGRCGVEVPEVELTSEEEAASRERRERREWLLKANQLAADRYGGALGSPPAAPARAYLERRGIGPDVRAAFRLGYADGQWESLLQHLERSSVPVQHVVDAGLARPREGGNGHYDFFRNRLMCPVTDTFGRVVGFSARALDKEDEDRAKYLNTTETPVFHKGKLLFGLEQARRAIRSKGRALLVEGNFDVLSLHEAGFDEAVASLGTALTAEQVTLLHRQTSEAVLLYDGDRAGQKSARAAIPLFVDADLGVRVVTLPTGVDPDDFVRSEGPQALEVLIERAPSGVEFAIRETVPDRKAPPEHKDRAVQAIGRLVSRVSGDLARAEYRRLTAELLEVPEVQIARFFRGAAPAQVVGRPDSRTAMGRDRTAEELLRLVTRVPELAASARDAQVLPFVKDTAVRLALSTWFDLVEAGQHGRGDAALLEVLDASPRAVIGELLNAGTAAMPEGEPGELLDDMLVQFEGRRLAADARVIREVRDAGVLGDEEAVRAKLAAVVDKSSLKRQR